ncbi:MAG: hypothetical protein ABIF77_18410 [bacterium]
MKQPQHIPSGRIFRLLIPPEPRRYSGQRWIKMIARSTHVVLSGIYLGALVFQVEPATRGPWFLAAMLSGLLMVCLDLYESGGFLLQLRGLVTAAKLGLLALLPTFGEAGVWVVAIIAFCSVISSHASSSVRYFLIWGRGRIQAAETKG